MPAEIPTPEEFAAKMLAIAHEYSEDASELGDGGHRESDEAMCDLLRQLGYGKAVAIFESAGKWWS